MTAGRPTKYSPHYCDELIECMGRGFSLTAFAGEIGVARSTINQWMGEYPEFSEAVKKGQAKRVRKLEETLLAGEFGPRVTAHIFALKNADPDEWRDRSEQRITHELADVSEEPLSAEEWAKQHAPR
jgi:hypothetical protein